MRLMSTVLLGSFVLSACASMSQPKPAAVAELKPTQGNNARGTVSFTPKGDMTMVEVHVEGLTPGQHGFHVHEKGDCSAPDATSAGGHFNPTSKSHGGPLHAEHHAGDFGNLTADASGKANMQMLIPASQISLTKGAQNSVIGRAVIVHADPDDLQTQPTGNSGKRVACGVIK